jgi:hypothetical protein
MRQIDQLATLLTGVLFGTLAVWAGVFGVVFILQWLAH